MEREVNALLTSHLDAHRQTRKAIHVQISMSLAADLHQCTAHTCSLASGAAVSRRTLHRRRSVGYCYCCDYPAEAAIWAMVPAQ